MTPLLTVPILVAGLAAAQTTIRTFDPSIPGRSTSRIATRGGTSSSSDAVSGNIGAGLLEGRILVLDYSAGRYAVVDVAGNR